MSEDTLTLDIRNCARCCSNHQALVFQPLKNSPTDISHWALCPIALEPILVKKGYTLIL